MSLPFPRSRQDSTANLSVTSRQSTTRATAQEVHELVYGHNPRVQAREGVEAALQRIYEPNAIYENPLLTATSREIIMDIYQATRQWSELDMPKPLAMLSTLFRRSDAPRDPWFRMLRVWSEVGDICETESFDGHRKSMIEHTLNILLLPGVHSGRSGRQTYSASDSSLDVVSSALYSLPHLQSSSQPSLAVPGTRMTWPSPLHLKLRIISRLEFNGERVTHHRDFWDVKDLVTLLPGAGIALYLSSRVTARALAAVGNIGAWLLGNKGFDAEPDDVQWTHPADNSLGLLGIDVESGHPGIDRNAM